MNRGPGLLRKKAVADPAIEVLVEHGWLTMDGQQKRAWGIQELQKSQKSQPA